MCKTPKLALIPTLRMKSTTKVSEDGARTQELTVIVLYDIQHPSGAGLDIRFYRIRSKLSDVILCFQTGSKGSLEVLHLCLDDGLILG